MRTFIDDDFLLENDFAKKLYRDYASKMPIIDYHCHIVPEEIASDKPFDNITQIWLEHDHYKWRYMRACGIDEKFITGNGTDYEKFEKYVLALKKAIGNPLYHWSYLELLRYFGYSEIIDENNVADAWEKINAYIKANKLSPRKMMQNSNVEVICTTDDPVDDLKYHKQLSADSNFKIKVFPTYRPDSIININNSFIDYLSKLSDRTGVEINTLADLKSALIKTISFFHEQGCRLADHGLTEVPYSQCSESEANEIFDKLINSSDISDDELMKYQTHMLLFFASEYCNRDWTMQLHYGCSRDNNKRMLSALGINTGFDCINPMATTQSIINLLNELNDTGNLPKTILYSLNPNDNAVIDTIIACFQDSSCASKIQHGCAWWFNDHKYGIENMILSLENNCSLSNFIGMLTDSRSFVSYTRHEYFRRILCNHLGKLVENNEFANDIETVGKITADISYNNAKSFFRFS